VLDEHSKPLGLPLILAALPEHHHLFREISANPFLMETGLSLNPAELPIDELRQRAWQIVEPKYQACLAALSNDFAIAKSNSRGSDDLMQVGKAAVTGRVATLLIEFDLQIGGRLDSSTGQIETADLSDPQVDDILDDLGELVVKMGGKVVVVPKEQMPGSTGLAGIYRY